jgi:hypothetical protein
MNKIPVRQTIAEAYHFTFAGLEKVIGLIWLPVVLLTIGRFFVLTDAASGAGDPTDMGIQGPIMLRGLVFDVVAVVLFAIAAVAITREILKPLDRPLFLRFALGPTELRVVGGYFALLMLLILLMVGLLLAVMMAAAAGKGAVGQVATAAGGILWLAGLCALVFIAVRMSFLLAPSVVLEGGFGLERSWLLTRGNFWRIVLIGLATVLPVLLVMMMAMLIVIGPDIQALHLELATDEAAQAQRMTDIMRVVAAHAPVLMGISFLLAPFSFGLGFSAPAFAYRALMAQQKPPA